MTRLLLTLGTLALVALAVWGMRRGWVHRQQRQADLLVRFPAPPPDVGPVRLGPLPGLYVGAVVAGDWQDRVAAQGLGLRAAGTLGVHDDGVLLTRRGSADVWVPRTELARARTDNALAGKVMTTAGLLVLTWRQDPTVASGPRPDPDAQRDTDAAAAAHPDIDLGFRADDPAAYPAVLTALGADEEDA